MQTVGSGGVREDKPQATGISGLVVLALVVTIAFLPAALRLTYYRDDWYYMMDGRMAGPAVFLEMFKVDRPARGFLFSWLFSAFGSSPLPYHLTMFGLRLASAFAAYWLFATLWPGKRSAPLWGALLFGLFPGYLYWVAGIEHLPMMLSVLLETISIALTLAAVQAGDSRRRILYWSMSILTGWAYLALVEYAIGMEFFRFLCIFLILGRRRTYSSVGGRISASLRSWLPAALIPIGFLAWRLLVFENTRAETDVARAFAVLLQEPVLTLLRWAVNTGRSLTNLVAFSWGVPLTDHLYSLRLSDIGAAFVAALAVAGIVAAHRIWNLRRARRADPPEDVVNADRSLWLETLAVGLFGALGAVLSIVVAGRRITFNDYSHYALPGSLAAVVVLVAGLQLLRPRTVALAFLAGLLAVATLTHHAVGTLALTEQEETARFWWQVAWRAPGLEPGTTFFVEYPSFDYEDDTSVVWGPANLLYDASPRPEIPVVYSYAAIAYPDSSLDEITSRSDHGLATYRSHSTPINLGKLLVASQTMPEACVRVLDGRSPLVAPTDPPQIRVAAPYSRIDLIEAHGAGAAVPEWLLGAEPDHGWCYYFEKAELALQERDFEGVVQLGRQVSEKGLKPLARIEWIPFARAYAILGLKADLQRIASRVNADSEDRRVACRSLFESRPPGYELSDSMYVTVYNLFCD